MKKKKDNFQKDNFSGSLSGSSADKLPESNFDESLRRLKVAFGVETDTDLARALDLQQGSISKAKQKRAIPPSWITTVALGQGVSADWLLTGEGEMRRDGMKFAGITQTRDLMQGKTQVADTAAMERQSSDAALIDPSNQNPNIADLVAKTIEVLQSKTVFQTALESNIEAFHHAIVLERKIDQVEDRIMEKVSKRFDELEKTTQQLGEANADLRTENQQLRQELEQSRAQSAIRDTG